MAVLLGAIRKSKLSADLQFEILMFLDDVYTKAKSERKDVTFRYKVLFGNSVIIAEAKRYPIAKLNVADVDEAKMLIPMIERYYKKLIKNK